MQHDAARVAMAKQDVQRPGHQQQHHRHTAGNADDLDAEHSLAADAVAVIAVAVAAAAVVEVGVIAAAAAAAAAAIVVDVGSGVANRVINALADPSCSTHKHTLPANIAVSVAWRGELAALTRVRCGALAPACAVAAKSSVQAGGCSAIGCQVRGCGGRRQ